MAMLLAAAGKLSLKNSWFAHHTNVLQAHTHPSTRLQCRRHFWLLRTMGRRFFFDHRALKSILKTSSCRVFLYDLVTLHPKVPPFFQSISKSSCFFVHMRSTLHFPFFKDRLVLYLGTRTSASRRFFYFSLRHFTSHAVGGIIFFVISTSYLLGCAHRVSLCCLIACLGGSFSPGYPVHS
jgi:hypothetical protein